MHSVNYRYAKDLGLSDESIEKLEILYKSLNSIFKEQEEYLKNDKEITSKKAEQWDRHIREIENEMQETWGFGKNSNMHHYWFEQPACQCPERDNWERIGIEERIINEYCPIHGHKKRII